ncbi:MAG: hypothetical protein LBJ64_04095 [Deltaproteobacteria bacterium]|jgi:hypothetical protein|nr:hypothetical protein [Deltaproteobacteria bacterium]
MTINNPDAYLEKEFQAQAADVPNKLGYTIISSDEWAARRGGRDNALLKEILRK